MIPSAFDNSGRGTFEGRTLYVKKGESPSSGLPAETGSFTSETAEPELSKSTIADSVPDVKPESQAFVDPDAPADDGLGAANSHFDQIGVAEDRYGTLPEGENPVRPDDIPRRTTDRNKVSLLARTIKGAGVVPDSFIPTLEKAVLDGKFSYIPHTNEQVAEQARKNIERKGWEQALADFRRDVARGKTSDYITAVGIELANNAANAGDIVTALDVFTDLQKNVRKAGQAAQAVRMLKQAAPAHRLYMIQKSVQQMTEAMELPEAALVLDQDTLARYLDAETAAERDSIITEIQQQIADQLPSSWLDKWTAFRYVNMLGNFRTQGRNLLGNVAMQGMRATKDLIATGLENAYYTINPEAERTKALRPGKALMDAAKADYESIEAVALGEEKYKEGTFEDAFQRGIQDKRTIFKDNGVWGLSENSPAIAKLARRVTDFGWAALEGYRKVTNWGMRQGDAVFTRHSYARALAGYLKAHGVSAEQFQSEQWKKDNTAFVDKARTYAIQEAQEATFRDSNAISDFVSQAGRGENTPRGVRIMGEGLSPFRKTPANVLVRAEEYSPLGFVNTVYEAFQASRGNASSADVINSLSKSLTGTGLMAAGFLLAQGLIPDLTFRGGDDPDDRQRGFDDLTGAQPYSAEYGGWSYTFDWVTPGAIPFFMGVQLSELMDRKDLTLDNLSGVLSSIGEPMLQGVNDALNDIKFSDNNLVQLAATQALSYLTQGLNNSLLGQAERTLEDVRQMTYTDKNDLMPGWLQRPIGKASARMPGLDYHQTPYIDEWGREESSGSVPARAAENFLSPGFASRVQTGDVERELQRLADAAGETSVYPSRADQSFEVNGERKYLTAEEYSRYAKTVGQTRYNILSSLFRHEGYAKLSDADKAKTISAAYEYATEIGKMEVSDYKPDQNTLNILNYPNLDKAPYFLYKRMMSIEDAKRNAKLQTGSQANTNVRNAIKNDSSLTVKEKNLLDDWIVSDVVPMDKDLHVDYANDETFAISQMSDSAQKHWNYVQERTGISLRDYKTAWSICSRTEKGYHKTDRINDLMDQLGVSKFEASQIYKACTKTIEDDEDE